jgi:hypothetical protein
VKSFPPFTRNNVTFFGFQLPLSSRTLINSSPLSKGPPSFTFFPLRSLFPPVVAAAVLSAHILQRAVSFSICASALAHVPSTTLKMARFQNVAPDLMALSRELERMGGGSASTITGAFFVRCRAAELGPSIIALQGDSVLLSNPQNPDQRGNKTFSCDASFSASCTQAQVSEDIATPIVNQLLKGFNCVVIAIGETGSGKSHTLFGNASDGSGSKGEGAVHCILDSLLKSAATSGGVAIDVAACEIGADACTDLFGNEAVQVLQFSSALSIAVTSSQEVRLLIRQALQKSRNACVNPAGQLLELAPNRSHLCFRIRVQSHERLSQVWIIDSVGSRPLAGARNSTRHFTSSPDVDREQRVLSQQLFGLSKLMSEISSVVHGARTLESARSSSLSFFVSNLITDNHSLVCIGTIHSEAAHHLDSYNTLRISSAARSIVVPCKHTKSSDDLGCVPAAHFLRHAAASKSFDSQKALARSPHPLPSAKSAASRAAVTPQAPASQTNAFGLSTSPTHVIELGSTTHHSRFRAATEADAFEISEDGASLVLSPTSGDAEDGDGVDFHAQYHDDLQQPVVSHPQLFRMQVPAVSDNFHRQSHVHEDDAAASEDDQSDDGVFFASKIIDDQAVAGSNQVGGWSTFLEENMSSSAASEGDHGSGSDAGGDFGHDSCSLKNAFQDTLAKVSSSSTTASLASVSAEGAKEQIQSHDAALWLGSSSSADRFSQQQPLTHTSASRQSFLQSMPAAAAISLIPVATTPLVSESLDSHSVFQESSDLKQVCK